MPAFIPFYEIKSRSNVAVVDAYHPRGLTLSHWRGATQIPALHDDVSTGIVLNAIEGQHPALDLPFVTNNHFDIDGLLGVWAFIEPELALQYRGILREAALIGDFREYSPLRPYSEEALKLVCWINEVEKAHFYRPFDSSHEARDCVEKYEFFLPRIAEVLADPDAYNSDWSSAYNRVQMDWELRRDPSRCRIEVVDSIKLTIFHLLEPIHYYALMGDTQDSDMILSIYPDNRYELEYKYTTWVDLAHREVLPRIRMEPIARILDDQEQSGLSWQSESIMDTGPMLYLGSASLDKSARYAHPYERQIHSSSIEPALFKQLVIDYYEEALAGIQPRVRWSWADIHAAQRNQE